MNGISTLTQKGQIVIPKDIREKLELRPFDLVKFELEGDRIIAEPLNSVDEIFGIAGHGKKRLTKSAYKKIIKDSVMDKFKNRQ